MDECRLDSRGFMGCGKLLHQWQRRMCDLSQDERNNEALVTVRPAHE